MNSSIQNTTTSAPSAEPREAHQRAGHGSTLRRETLESVKPYLSFRQYKTMIASCAGEEGEFFRQTFIALSLLLSVMPSTYAQDGKGDEATAFLHYFLAGSDWYITEKDMDGGVTQAYGYAILNGDLECSEPNYISITELVSHGAELDLHWTPKTLREIKAEKAQ